MAGSIKLRDNLRKFAKDAIGPDDTFNNPISEAMDTWNIIQPQSHPIEFTESVDTLSNTIRILNRRLSNIENGFINERRLGQLSKMEQIYLSNIDKDNFSNRTDFHPDGIEKKFIDAYAFNVLNSKSKSDALVVTASELDIPVTVAKKLLQEFQDQIDEEIFMSRVSR